ncbi:MAG: carboxypeptidase-like regulatory domain-containing protein [Pirellulales bacterium]
MQEPADGAADSGKTAHRVAFTATLGIEDRTSWTALAPSTPVEGKPNYMLIAQVTLGGQFPVVLNDEKLPAHGKELFTIKMTRGNDDVLDVLVTKPDGEEEQIELVRDKSIDVRVGDETYNLSYSTTTVAADQPAETDKATIIVSWRPDTDSGTQHGGDRADKPNANDGATATPPKRATFAIDGRCVDGDGNPVPGATVTLVNTEHYAVGNELIARTQSAADGRFRFANAPNLPLNDLDKLPLGVAAQSSGRASAFGEVSSDEPPEMQLVLLPSEPLRGRVTDVDGHPIAGALVRFGLTLPRIEDFACAYTDDDGEFQKYDVSETGDPAPPAKKLDAITLYPWAYRITAEGFVSQTRSYLEQRPREVQVELERGASMTGRVLFADSGLPAAGVRVAVSPSPSGKKGPPESEPRAADGAMIHIPAALTITDKSGQFRVSGLRGGPHDASFFAADYAGSRVDRLQLTVGETLESDGVQLVRGGVVYGTLIDSDTGAALDASDNRISLELSRRPREPGGSAASARVQADGTFRIRVLPGEYQLGVVAVFHAAGRSPDRKGFWKFLGHVPFELTGRPTRDITIAEGEEKELVLEGRMSPLPAEVRANAKDSSAS